MALDRTPSDIEIDESSSRPRFASHESLGYRADSGNSYSLPKSPTPVDAALSSDRPSAIADESTMPEIGDTSMASLTGIDYLKTDTTRVLERALEHEQLSSQTLTDVPPHRVSHTDYAEYAQEAGDGLLSYTQVLIWCLQRRISRIERNPPRDLTTSRYLELLQVLKSARDKLVAREIVLNVHSHELIKLKPRMPNPENERSAEITADLDEYRRRLLSQNRESWKLLSQAEKLSRSSPSNELAPMENRLEPVLTMTAAEKAKSISAVCEKLNRIDALYASSLHYSLKKLDNNEQLVDVLSHMADRDES